MSIVPTDNRSFTRTVISGNILTDAISWISDNLDPADVFTREQLVEWATDNGFRKKETEQ